MKFLDSVIEVSKPFIDDHNTLPTDDQLVYILHQQGHKVSDKPHRSMALDTVAAMFDVRRPVAQ
jgi:hypothetical protein